MSIPSPSHTGRNKNMNYSSSPDKFLQSLYQRKTKKKSHIRYHVVFSSERWLQWVFHFLQIFSAMSQTLLKGLTKHMLTFLAKRKYTIKKRERRSYLTHVRKCKFLLACRFFKICSKIVLRKCRNEAVCKYYDMEEYFQDYLCRWYGVYVSCGFVFLHGMGTFH